eukprot:scaffold21364_cov135-Isochrysis_galbana.AAC.2
MVRHAVGRRKTRVSKRPLLATDGSLFPLARWPVGDRVACSFMCANVCVVAVSVYKGLYTSMCRVATRHSLCLASPAAPAPDSYAAFCFWRFLRPDFRRCC